MTGARRRKLIMIALCLLLVAGAAFYGLRPAPISYQTVKVELRDLERSVLATGRLDAVRKVNVGAQVSGQLQKLYVKVGDQVVQDQPLALIDPQQAQNQVLEGEATLNELQAQLKQAQAEARLARVTLQRRQALLNKQALSRQELDQSTAEQEVKALQLEILQAQIRKQQAVLATARTNLGYTRINAPMDGEVVKITTLQGQTVIAALEAPNLLTLADMDRMLVNAQIPEADIIHLKPGQAVWFTILGDSHRRYDGKLQDIQPTPEKINNAYFYHARFEVPNQERRLRLDMTAQVHIVLEQQKQVLTIPLTALREQREEDGLWQVRILRQGQGEIRQVKLGMRNNLYAQVLSGLQAGEEVIIGRNEVGES